VTKWLVKQFLDESDATVSTKNQAALFKPGKISPDTWCGHAHFFRELLNGDFTGPKQSLHDPVSAQFDFLRHESVQII
jgi:hypothetical protein